MGGSTKSDFVQRSCPASLFYQVLILIFSPEPKTYLLDSKQYLRPALYERFEGDKISEEVPFSKLTHRAHYMLIFEQPSENEVVKTVAYSLNT